MTQPTDKEKTRLLMNSDQAKDIYAWLTEDKLFEFNFLYWDIQIWKGWPFIFIDRRTK